MREETLLTGRDQRLRGHLWTEDGDAQGVVIIVHGLGDHGGRYHQLARQLTRHGWNVLAFDLPGHGLSPGRRGRISHYDDLLADIAQVRQTVTRQLPGARQVILGHSMGGNLALSYVLRRQQLDPAPMELAGLVLCGPMLLPPNPPPRPQIFAAWLTGRLIPWLTVGRPVDVSLLTQDADCGRAIQNDSLMHSRISIYLATQLLSQGRWAIDHARNVDVPSLIMYGEEDQLIDRSACEHAAVRIGPQATLVRWPNSRHDLFHETMRDQITERLIQWLETL